MRHYQSELAGQAYHISLAKTFNSKDIQRCPK